MNQKTLKLKTIFSLLTIAVVAVVCAIATASCITTILAIVGVFGDDVYSYTSIYDFIVYNVPWGGYTILIVWLVTAILSLVCYQKAKKKLLLQNADSIETAAGLKILKIKSIFAILNIAVSVLVLIAELCQIFLAVVGLIIPEYICMIIEQSLGLVEILLVAAAFLAAAIIHLVTTKIVKNQGLSDKDVLADLLAEQSVAKIKLATYIIHIIAAVSTAGSILVLGVIGVFVAVLSADLIALLSDTLICITLVTIAVLWLVFAIFKCINYSSKKQKAAKLVPIVWMQQDDIPAGTKVVPMIATTVKPVDPVDASREN